MASSLRVVAFVFAILAQSSCAGSDTLLSASEASDLPDDECMAGSTSEECSLSLRQLRIQRKTAEVQAHSSNASVSAPGFCCYAGATDGKTCSTCLPTAKALADDFCAAEANCGSCGGTWCTAQCVYAGEDPSDTCGTALETATAASDTTCAGSETACTECKGSWCGVDAETAPAVTTANDTVAVDAVVLPHAGFCCYGGTDTANTCGTCEPTEVAKEGDYCASAQNCGGCNGTWCSAICVYSGADPTNVCGTAFESAIAPATEVCSHSGSQCADCHGTWCAVGADGSASSMAPKEDAPEAPAEEDTADEVPRTLPTSLDDPSEDRALPTSLDDPADVTEEDAVAPAEDASEAEALIEEDVGPASGCRPGNHCSRNNICQKLANNGGHPIGGTVSCKNCVGDRKCQVFGVGSAFTCGCSVAR